MYYDFIFRGVLTSENSETKVPITMKLYATDYDSAVDEIEILQYWEDNWKTLTGEDGEKVKCIDRQIDCTGSFTTLFSRLKDKVRNQIFPLKQNRMYNSQDAWMVRRMEQVMFLTDLKVSEYEAIERKLKPVYGEYWQTTCFTCKPEITNA